MHLRKIYLSHVIPYRHVSTAVAVIFRAIYNIAMSLNKLAFSIVCFLLGNSPASELIQTQGNSHNSCNNSVIFLNSIQAQIFIEEKVCQRPTSFGAAAQRGLWRPQS